MSFIIAGGLIVVVFTLFMYVESKRNRLRELTLTYKTLPTAFNGYRLFFISDIHRRTISNKVLEKVKNNVNFIIIGGDLCEKGVPLHRIEANIKKLSKLAPCVFVWGNNDHEVGTEHLKIILKKYSVIELVNTKKVIEVKQEQLILVGIDDLESASDSFRSMEVSMDSFSILICHYPEIAAKLPSKYPFPLVLSGHTHGGQIRLFGLGIARKGGLYRYAQFDLLISNGYGTTGLPLRLGAPAETHLITLTQSNI
ncbi:metallophosphoesterase [Alkalihalobacillus deserti]|uniref:metallophosphoesterase n=1 Tax=Alkalihalobacillus deserti TaxID=2879466 RepID=UPI001D155D51|nr:metallophosphoesterase [Alkalihalobacillus deserti]